MTVPLPLKIIVAVLAVLIILLFVIKKKKRKYIWLLIIAVIGAGAWYGYELYHLKNPDYINVKADVKISAMALIHEYEANDSVSNQKYLGKVVEVDGTIKSIEKDDAGYYTVVLGDRSGLSSVRCAMDTTHHQDAALLAEGSSAILRGNCTGFNKDDMGLGSDVILNRSVIVRDKK
jgi:hypothetical protein